MKIDMKTEAFEKFEEYKTKRRDILVAIDMSQPSNERRLYVYDVATKKELRRHHVSHGVNSSDPNNRARAIYFSNKPQSHMSSLGAMVTAETYMGGHGYSLRLDGLEKGKNDNVRKRFIVVHAADYVTDKYIKKNKRAGQSHGCPAVDPAIAKDLIDLIKGGVFFYVYF